MPTIKSSADLRNDYNGISTLCHTYQEPIFITKNGKGNPDVISIEAYEQLTARFELYTAIEKGMQDIQNGESRPFVEAMSDLRGNRKK